MTAPFVSTVPARSAAALAVDLGSCTAGVWATHQGAVSGPSGDGGALVRRGRVVDFDGCVELLTQLAQRYPQPVPAAAVAVICRPVLATDSEQADMRRVVDAAFAPRRTLFIDTVRAAAIGSGAATGSLLVADVGAQLTEVALLKRGRVTEARRRDIGTRDLGSGATIDLITDVVAQHLDDLRAACPASDMQQATARGLLLVGDGATHPDLSSALAGTLKLRVHRAAAPRTAALDGAGIAATSALRHPALA
ncbi:rod shape-determining protein [Actinoplanes sp. NPDC024001]|uniref:rod shape-determining protein n=1 Tax=Actinoplanes sp. NPDC024001 TaxID=3154598 RepID=UPI0033F48743